jgi:hypothetical protein
MKEGYWKFVLDETASPWYNANLNKPSTNWDGGLDNDWFYNKGRMSPVDYSQNPTLHESLPGHVDSSKNLQVSSTGVRYRSRFTRSLNVRAFFPEKDLVTGVRFTRVTKTMTPGVLTTDTQVDAPYTKVVGYGGEWGSSLNVDRSTEWSRFIKTRNSSGQDGTTGFPHISEITANERFSNTAWRFTPNFKKRTINRRHLILDGVTINGGDKFTSGYYGSQISMYETDPIWVRQGAPSSPGSLFPSGDGQVKGWFIDFRGCVFKNCTFKNVGIGGFNETCFSGASFLNCKFINCAINTNGDSILFSECSFIGGCKQGPIFTPPNFHSSAFISCQFLNNDRFFIFTSSRGPVSDNLWWRNEFDNYVNMNGGGSELLCTEFPGFMRSGAHQYAFETSGTGGNTDYIQQQHEYARNMFIFNRFHSGLGGIVSSYETFSRANFFYSNTFNDPIKIYGHTPSYHAEDKCLYESWAHNFIHKLSIALDGKSHHFRFICNAISEPHFNSSKSIDNHWTRYPFGNNAWIVAQGVEADASAPTGEWYCVNTTGMGNKIIGNQITNWGDYFMNNALGPCSIFNGFHHVYDPDFDINISGDSYWGQNNRWKYVNVATRNRFFMPSPFKNYGWHDGEIGRKNADGTSWNPSRHNNTGSRLWSPMPLEWQIKGDAGVHGESAGGPPNGFQCSQTASDISARNECRSIYVKNVSTGVWEKKNTGVLYSNEANLNDRTGWSQQIFKSDLITNGLVLFLDASRSQSIAYGSGASFDIPDGTLWKNIVSNGFHGTVKNVPRFAGINGASPHASCSNTYLSGSLAGQTINDGSGGSIKFNCTDTNDSVIVSNINSSGVSVANTFSASTTNFITLQIWARFRTLPNQGILGKGTNALATGWDGYSIQTDGASKLLIVTNGGSAYTTHSSIATASSLSLDKWYLITAVIKIGSSSGDVQGYVNNNRVINSSHGAESSYDDTANPLTIAQGYRNSTSAFSFNGWIGEFYFYNRALTANEISNNYTATKGRFVY